MGHEDRVRVTIDGGVADVRLNRPDKRNALDQAMFEALVITGTELAADASLRAVVLSGEGPDFCAGLDFGSFQAMASGERLSARAQLPEATGPARATGQRAVHVWAELPVPVIAAIRGNALGGGMQVALGADIRIVAPDASMGLLEVPWGLVPDMTGTQVLPELVGRDVAKELVFTGRRVTGTEAARLGLATRVADDPLAEALELARTIAGMNPHSVRGAKRLLDMAGRVGLTEGFAAEQEEIGALIGSPNQVEAVTARFEKRAPQFAD
jgi:enoyl-CoA hydratase/carnithine racemase